VNRERIDNVLGKVDTLAGILPDLMPGSGIDDMAIAGARGLIAVIRSLLRSGREPDEILELLRRWRDEGAARFDVDETVDAWLAKQRAERGE
jgi:hypothetical protein